MGLPQRNYSVLKQTHMNQWEIKGKRPTHRSGVGLKALGRGLGVGGRERVKEKRKQKKKEPGEHRRIYNRRSIKQVKGWE